MSEKRGSQAGVCEEGVDLGWEGARRAWLEGQGREQTRRGYERAMEAFLGFVGQPPERVTAEEVGGWVEQMKRRGVKASTIRYRLGAAASFYRFASQRLGLEPAVNPAAEWRKAGGRARSRGGRRWLSQEEAAGLLGVVDVETVWGRRDYALFLACLRTGRRVTELTALRWGDIEEDEDGVWYWWQGKRAGRESEGRRRSRLDRETWEAMREYLAQAGRLEGMQDGNQAEDFIFTPLSDPAGRLQKLYGDGWRKRALGVNVIERDLRMYADGAGLEKNKVTPTTLRYTAARLRLEAGATVEEVGELLGFCERDVTLAFLKRMGWKKLPGNPKGLEIQPGLQNKPLGLVGAEEGERFQRWRRGGQARNQNALRHGFYARYFEPDEEEWKAAWMARSPNYAIALMRIKLGRLLGYANTIKEPMRAVRVYSKFGGGCKRVAKAILALARSQGLLAKEPRWDREFVKAMRRRRANVLEEESRLDMERLREAARRWREEDGLGEEEKEG